VVRGPGWTTPVAPGIRTGGIGTARRCGWTTPGRAGGMGSGRWTGVRWGDAAPDMCGWAAVVGLARRTGGTALPGVPCIAVPGIHGGAAPDACGIRTGGMGAARRWGCTTSNLCGSPGSAAGVAQRTGGMGTVAAAWVPWGGVGRMGSGAPTFFSVACCFTVCPFLCRCTGHRTSASSQRAHRYAWPE
jgi:hypothetical protein